MQLDYSTSGLKEAEQFEYWRDVVCKHCIPAVCEAPISSSFDASIRIRSVGALAVANMVGPKHEWTRDANCIRTSPESGLWLSFMESGVGYLEQNGRTVVQNAGDIVLYDAARPFNYSVVPESFFIVRLPRDLLLLRAAAAERMIATSLGAGSGFRTVLGSLIKELSIGQRLDSAPAAEAWATSAVFDLIACLIDHHEGKGVSKGVTEALYDRVCSYVLRHIEDPDLSAESIAQVEHVSARTVARVFAFYGTTPMRYIWQKRLEASYCALAQGSVRKVSEAAMNYGFADLSHFSRSFKKAFGVSPHTMLLRH